MRLKIRHEQNQQNRILSPDLFCEYISISIRYLIIVRFSIGISHVCVCVWLKMCFLIMVNKQTHSWNVLCSCLLSHLFLLWDEMSVFSKRIQFKMEIHYRLWATTNGEKLFWTECVNEITHSSTMDNGLSSRKPEKHKNTQCNEENSIWLFFLVCV